MINDCENNNPRSFSGYLQILLKSFVLVISIFIIITLKNNYLKSDKLTLSNIIIFIILSSFIFSFIGLSNGHIYNNIVVGIGIAIGMNIMNLNIINR